MNINQTLMVLIFAYGACTVHSMDDPRRGREKETEERKNDSGESREQPPKPRRKKQSEMSEEEREAATNALLAALKKDDLAHIIKALLDGASINLIENGNDLTRYVFLLDYFFADGIARESDLSVLNQIVWHGTSDSFLHMIRRGSLFDLGTQEGMGSLLDTLTTHLGGEITRLGGL